MIVNRAFYREIVQTGFVVTAVFVVLYVVITLVSLLAKAAAGKLPADVIFALLGLQTVKNLSIILPLAMFVGILMTLSRWYRDSEMTVLAACGIGLMHFLRPAWVIATAFAIIVGLVSFYFAPLATSVIAKIRAENTDAARAGILPGEFQRSKKDGAIFYVEDVDADGALRNIFAHSPQLGRLGVVVAQSGYHYTDPRTGENYLVLEHGKRYEGVPGRADYRVLSYQTYAMRVESPAQQARTIGLDETSSRELWGSDDPVHRAEWQWRLAKPLALIILAPLALVFAYTDARRGRFANLFSAMLLYFLYANLLGFGHALLKQGRANLDIGLWWVHVLMALFAAYLLWRRANHRPLLPGGVRA